MAKPSIANAARGKKKRATDDDDTPKRRKAASADVMADEDEGEDDAEDEDSDDDDADDDEEEEEEDDSDSEDDDDDDDADDGEEEDADSEDDEEEEEEDEEEEAPPKKKKAKAKGGAEVHAGSFASEDATGGGLFEGRCVLKRFRCRLGNKDDYNEDDADGIPMISCLAVPVDKAGAVVGDPVDLHWTNGKPENRVPTDDGLSFEHPEGTPGGALARNSNAFLFIKSVEDAGFPPETLRTEGIPGADGVLVEIVRQPQPVRRGLAAADPDTDAQPKTYAHVTRIYALPDSPKGKAARVNAVAALKALKAAGGAKVKGKAKTAGAKAKGGKRRPKAEAETPEPKRKATAKAPRVEEGDLADDAEAAIEKALNQDDAAKKGLSDGELFPAAFQFLRDHPKRKAVLAYVGNPDWYRDEARPWFYDEATERLHLTEPRRSK